MPTSFNQAFGFLNQRWKRRSLILLFSDVESAENSKAVSKALAAFTRRHLVALVRVVDNGLLSAARDGASSVDGIFQRAAAQVLVADREKASAILDSAGVHHVEAEAKDLSRALVNYYFSVKERGLL